MPCLSGSSVIERSCPSEMVIQTSGEHRNISMSPRPHTSHSSTLSASFCCTKQQRDRMHAGCRCRG